MAEPQLPPLAQPLDVATALGVNEIELLPGTMQIRMDTTLAKVSRRFRKEAQRLFTPGVYTHTLLIQRGAVRLMEAPTEVSDVRVEGLITDGVDVPQFHVDGIWLYWDDWHRWRLNGRRVDVTYSWDTPVPEDVVTAVADITGRNLVLDPLSAVRQSKTLRSKHFEQQMADWVVSGDTGFSADDICQAQSYRYPAPPIIIANMDTSERGISEAFLSDGSW